MKWRIGTIKSTHLGFEDHGILTAIVHFEGDGWGQGFGLYGYWSPYWQDEDAERRGAVKLREFITETCRVVGVDTWEKLKGQMLFVLSESTKIHGIRSLQGGRAFFPEGEPADMPTSVEVV